MRRLVATVGALALAMGVVGVLPAAATHCAAGPGIADCPNPIAVVITEGVGNVCSAATPLRNPTTNGTKCTYDLNDPSWVGKPVFQFWEDEAQTKVTQGLYWPGVGPGAVGPYRLSVGGAPTPPSNVCVDNTGAGCSAYLEGKLTAGGATGVGAHCGSSTGTGILDYTSADGLLHVEGSLGWDQSAATILPLTGTVNKINGAAAPNPKPSIIGFSSSRGLTGAGNCGANQATTGFQVEGITVTY